jgi:hypothetical protein
MTGNVLGLIHTEVTSKVRGLALASSLAIEGELRSDGPLVRAWDWRDRRVAGKQHG